MWYGKTCNELPGNCTGNYDANTRDPTSHKGQWVFYDFDKFFGSNGYWITARNPYMHTALRALSLTPPDPTSGEPQTIDTYPGILLMNTQIYLPSVER